jgi:hypothetical protein
MYIYTSTCYFEERRLRSFFTECYVTANADAHKARADLCIGSLSFALKPAIDDNLCIYIHLTMSTKSRLI